MISIAVTGSLPFAVFFIELAYLLRSAWNYQIYQHYGYLAFVLLVAVICGIEATICWTYFQLSQEV